MKNYLKEKFSPDPLQNIKNEMGSLRHITGNPFFSSEINLQITKNYFLNGVQIAPAGLPVNLQTPLPFFLLGLSDSQTSFASSQYYVNNLGNWRIPDNSGQRLGSELLDWNAARLVGFWDFVNFANGAWNFPGAFISFNHGGGGGASTGSLIKLNFWQPGHKYRIGYKSLFSTTGNSTVIGQRFNVNNGGGLNLLNFSSFVNNFYDVVLAPASIGGTRNLNIESVCSAAGQIDYINYLSIREIFGNDSFTGDPAFGIYGYTKTNTLSQNVQRGDAILTYTANADPTIINCPLADTCLENTYICEIVIHCDNIPYGSFLNALASDLINVNYMRYIVPIANVNQLDNSLYFIYQKLFGKRAMDSIDPNAYQTNKDFQVQICDIPVNFPIDKNLSIASYMNFNCTQTSFVLFVNKIEPLTLRNKYR